jgi:hypothetical protein
VLDTRAWRPTAELEGETPLTVSPDGRWAVLKDGGLWDTRHPSAGPIRLAYSFVSEAAFSPDSRRLVIGHPDGTASAWDVDVLATHSAARARRAAPTLDQLWERLAGRDGEQAEDAIARLAARPGKAIALVAARVRPVPPVDSAAVRERVAGLNAPRFADREAASRWLLEAGEQVVPEVRKTMAGRPSAEQRRRLEDLLARFEARDQAPDLVRAVRSVELLERVGGPGARRALEDLAGGAPGARLTAEAKAALARLDP